MTVMTNLMPLSTPPAPPEHSHTHTHARTTPPDPGQSAELVNTAGKRTETEEEINKTVLSRPNFSLVFLFFFLTAVLIFFSPPPPSLSVMFVVPCRGPIQEGGGP